jgi:peptidoglycan-N-acetylglucosamine deacetylase
MMNLKKKKTSSKIVFLTFDDGPSPNNTLKILDALNENDVKATFFVVGEKADKYPNIVKKLDDSGMCIAAHTYSHDYSTIYKNVDCYMEDYNKCTECIKELLGKDVISYMRIPGGAYNKVSSETNMKCIRQELNRKHINYVDWNVSLGDALGRNIYPYKLKKNVIDQCKDKDLVVLLMHDSYYKETTVEVLPDVIKYLKEQGYSFKTFDEITLSEKEYLEKEKIMNK